MVLEIHGAHEDIIKATFVNKMFQEMLHKKQSEWRNKTTTQRLDKNCWNHTWSKDFMNIPVCLTIMSRALHFLLFVGFGVVSGTFWYCGALHGVDVVLYALKRW
jgi:hypothetical protein